MDNNNKLSWEFYATLNDLLDRLTASSHASNFKNVDNLSDYEQMTVFHKCGSSTPLIQFDILGTYLAINHWRGKELSTRLLLCIEGHKQGKGLRTHVQTFNNESFTFNVPTPLLDIVKLIRSLEPEKNSVMNELADDLYKELFNTAYKENDDE